MHHPKTLATAILVLLAGSLIGVQFFHHKAESEDSVKAELVSTNHPWHMVGWIHGTTTTSTTVPSTTIPARPTQPRVSRSTPTRVSTPVRGTYTGDFASCVRQKESGNNYAYNDGTYHGAYNMTTSHWGGYGGYSRPEDAPPSVQDEKFQSDVAQGSGYMHQQYPVTSRACGG